MHFNFDNSYVRDLEGFYAPWHLDPPAAPELLVFNRSLAAELNPALPATEETKLSRIFGGAELPDGAEPVALAYAGHQFGHFSPQLGDGRALLLGEVVTPDGKRLDIQLKGSGRTPFSRNGDGKSALGPALREYLVSEAMHALGIPTTRSLAVVATGDSVQREQMHPGAVLTRIASSHLRVGTFQFFAAHQGAEQVRRLADYTIARHYPEVASAPNPYLALLDLVIDAQAQLVAAWMNIGFIHGVMNTDNVSISGETIDYGPCAFLDGYSAQTVFSSIDTQGRYAFGNQPAIARWNLGQFAIALAEIIANEEENQDKAVKQINAQLADFPNRYLTAWLGGLRRKLGLTSELEEDVALAQRLFEVLEEQNVDFTRFFRQLADVPEMGVAAISDLFGDSDAITAWIGDWQSRIGHDALPDAERRSLMNSANPVYIPRNHKVEEALGAAERGDMQLFDRLLGLVTNPYEPQEDAEDYALGAAEGSVPYVTYCGT